MLIINLENKGQGGMSDRNVWFTSSISCTNREGIVPLSEHWTALLNEWRRFFSHIAAIVLRSTYSLTDKKRGQVQQQQKTCYFIILQVYRWITISDRYGFDSANNPHFFSKTTATKSVSLFSLTTQFWIRKTVARTKTALVIWKLIRLVDDRVELLLKTQLEECLFKRIVKDSA